MLLSPKGALLAHPKSEWVAEGKTLAQMAQEGHDESLWRCLELALRGQRGEVESLSYQGGQPTWIFSEPVPVAHWTLQSSVFQEESAINPVAHRRALIALACSLIAMLALLGLAAMGVAGGSVQALWQWHTLISVLLALGICLLWGLTLAFPDPPSDQAVPILNHEQLEKYLVSRSSSQGTGLRGPAFRIPTGLFLKTLRFDSSNDAVVTGLVWQRYPLDFPKELSRGFVLPNAEDLQISEAFSRSGPKGQLLEYNFKATLREAFDRTVKYPFDQAVVRLPLWPKDFDAQVILVPDLEAYHLLNPASLPGLDEGLVLPGWNKERSYFGFLETTHTTTFGAADKGHPDQPPELSFQLVLTRKFLDPFISAMLPVLVVGCLLFALLMVGTKDQVKVLATGFKATDILPVAATLLFPVIYSQISLRSRLSSNALLYLEYFYFVMYAAILLVAANALAFALGKDGFVHHEDNVLAKLFYWPALLGSFFVISLVFLY